MMFNLFKEDIESKWYRSLPETKLLRLRQRYIWNIFRTLRKMCNASTIMCAHLSMNHLKQGMINKSKERKGCQSDVLVWKIPLQCTIDIIANEQK